MVNHQLQIFHPQAFVCSQWTNIWSPSNESNYFINLKSKWIFIYSLFLSNIKIITIRKPKWRALIKWKTHLWTLWEWVGKSNITHHKVKQLLRFTDICTSCIIFQHVLICKILGWYKKEANIRLYTFYFRNSNYLYYPMIECRQFYWL